MHKGSVGYYNRNCVKPGNVILTVDVPEATFSLPAELNFFQYAVYIVFVRGHRPYLQIQMKTERYNQHMKNNRQ